VRSVTILREGKRRVIVPTDAVWDDIFDTPGVDLGDPSPQGGHRLAGVRIVLVSAPVEAVE